MKDKLILLKGALETQSKLREELRKRQDKFNNDNQVLFDQIKEIETDIHKRLKEVLEETK